MKEVGQWPTQKVFIYSQMNPPFLMQNDHPATAIYELINYLQIKPTHHKTRSKA